MREQEPYPPHLHEDEEKPRRLPIFDPTINLGHLLTFISFIIIGVGIYSSLDKRVLVLETSTSRQDMRDMSQDADRARISSEMKDSVNDIKRTVERMNEKIDRLNDMRK